MSNSVNGSQITYGYDHSTRVSGVTGSGYGGVSSYASNIRYRAWSGLKSVSYGNSRALSVSYDNRLRPTQWNIPGVMGWNYAHDNFNEKTGRITYAQNINDATLDRSYDYDHVGRLIEARTASEARGHLEGQGGTQDGPYAHSYRYNQMGNMWYRVGWGGWFNPWLEQWPSYVNNRLTTNPWTGASMSYDAAGNLTNDGYQTYTYDATGQQTYASGTTLTQSYDGDRLRVKKVESGVTTYYLRSSVLGGQVISELTAGGALQRGYVYLGNELLAIQQNNQVSWVHQDPVTKSQRLSNSSGAITSTIDLDPWGGETSRSSNQAFQPHRYTSYERDGNGGDEAMMRRYTGKWHRFSQPDPYDGSYDLTNPQSFNRYAYVQNDPVNFVDPSGLLPQICGLFNLGDGRSGFVCFGDPAPFDGWEPKPGGPPDNPSTPEPQNPSSEPNDCLKFAGMVDQIADDLSLALASPQLSGGGQAFMDRLATTFTEFRSASILAVALQRGGYSNEGFGRFHDSGFHRDYRDPDPDSDNQVRHAVGGLIAGYILGSTPANVRVMDRREDLKTASGQADSRLNRLTMPNGNLLRNGIGFMELGQWLRDNICEKPSQGHSVP